MTWLTDWVASWLTFPPFWLSWAFFNATCQISQTCALPFPVSTFQWPSPLLFNAQSTGCLAEGSAAVDREDDGVLSEAHQRTVKIREQINFKRTSPTVALKSMLDEMACLCQNFIYGVHMVIFDAQIKCAICPFCSHNINFNINSYVLIPFQLK